jgi:hypothetical protein
MHAARSLVLAVLALASVVALAQPRFPARTERVEMDIAQTFDRSAALVGELRIPASDCERLHAVVIVNKVGVRRAKRYAEGLNAAGIVSFEVDMFQAAASRRGSSRTCRTRSKPCAGSPISLRPACRTVAR